MSILQLSKSIVFYCKKYNEAMHVSHISKLMDFHQKSDKIYKKRPLNIIKVIKSCKYNEKGIMLYSKSYTKKISAPAAERKLSARTMKRRPELYSYQLGTPFKSLAKTQAALPDVVFMILSKVFKHHILNMILRRISHVII